MILLRDDLGVIPDAIRLARATLATIRRNLAWAFGYNIAAIPLAAAGFLNPLIAGAAMAASSAFVVASSIRLRRFGTPRPPRPRPAARRAGPRSRRRGQRRPARGRIAMPGMNSGIDVSDPTVVAAFKAALVHQGLIALLIFALLGLAWVTVRTWTPAAAGAEAAPGPRGPALAEPAWRRCCGSASACCGSSTGSCRPSRRWRSGSRRRSSSRSRPAHRGGCSRW